jgi:putative ABC transport system permease protein
MFCFESKVKDLGALTRAVRNMSRRKMRTSLVVIALGFSMAIMISIPAGIVANQTSAQSLTANYNSTITNMQEEINKTSTLIQVQTSSGGGMFPGGFGNRSDFQPGGFERPGFEEPVYINETVVEEIRSIENVKDAVPFLEASSNETTSETISGPGGRNFTIFRPLYSITGVCLNSSIVGNYSILPTNITAGRNLREGDNGVLLMSSNLTGYFGVGVDGQVEINGEPFTVVGTYEQTGQGGTATRTVYMNISDAQAVTGLTGNASRLDVYADSTADVVGIAEVIQAAYSDLRVTTYEDRLSQLQSMQTTYEETLANAQSTLSQTQTTATQEIIIVIVATSLIVLFVMLYTVRERTKEIGTLKAIGFSNWNVMGQFVLEGVLMSVMAGVAGIVIGSIAAPVLSSLLLPHISLFSGPSGSFRPGFGATNTIAVQNAVGTLDPQLMLFAVGAAVLLGALGSLYPAWRAAKIKPAEAMRYE